MNDTKVINGKPYEVKREKNSSGKWEHFYKYLCECGHEKWVPHCELEGTKKRKFCSRKCRNLNDRTSVDVQCANCNKWLLKTPSKIARSKTGLFFCSRKCKDKQSVIGGLIAPAHYGTAKLGKYSTPSKRKYARLYKKGIKSNNCLICGIEVINQFCSVQCDNKYRAQRYIERWLRGEEDGTRKAGLRYGVSRFVRQYLYETRGEKCELCGWCETNPVTNKIPVQIDHIDGNHKNNHIENLRILCPNCHTLTPNYGSLNKGNGRADKMEYYYRKKKEMEEQRVMV